jgi:hypothetical protein
MAVGGDITEITYNHPNLGTGVFSPKSNEDNTYFVGGVTSESDANMITGNGTMIRKMTRSRGFFVALCANDQNLNQDLEKAIALSGHPVPADWTITNTNGTVYGCSGFPVGDFEGNLNQATFSLRVETGQLKKIVG